MSRRSAILHALFMVLWLALLLIFQMTDYPDWVSLAVRLKPEISQNPGLFSQYLPPAVFQRLTPAVLFVLVIHVLLLVWYYRQKDSLKQTLTHLKRVFWFPGWLYIQWNKLNRAERSGVLLVLGFAALLRIWLSSRTGVIYDEAWSWLAFTSKNPLLATCFYPTSNNHILFSHLTQVTQLAPFSILTNQRLASLIPLLFTLLTLIFLLKDKIPFRYSLPAVWMISMTFPLEYYGFVARGYTLILFFFTIGYFAVWRLAKNSMNHTSWAALSVSSALGMYTIPVYLYPMVTLFGYLLIRWMIARERPPVFLWIRYAMITGVFILCLYLPVFVVSGPASVTSNKFVQSSDLASVLSSLPTHTLNTLCFFSGNENLLIGLIPVVGFIILILLSKGSRESINFALFCLLAAPVFIVIHRLIPVERTWIYLALPACVMMAEGLRTLKHSIAVWTLAVITICILNLRWNAHMLWYDALCEEDYSAGKHYTDYFAGKHADIITPTRMNSYLKFNAVLKLEDWNIYESTDTMPSEHSWYIDYREETLVKAPENEWVLKDTFGHYKLYDRRIP